MHHVTSLDVDAQLRAIRFEVVLQTDRHVPNG